MHRYTAECFGIQRWLQQLHHRFELGNGASQPLFKQGIEVSTAIFGGIPERCPMAPGGYAHGVPIEIEQMQDELIRMLSNDAVISQDARWEIIQVESHDHVGLAANGRRQYMPIIGIRQIQTVDQTLVARHQAIGNALVHQLASTL